MKKTIIYLFIISLFLSCSGNNINDNIENPNNQGNTNNGNNNGSWLIPKSEVKDGGPGKDGIPSIDNPKFILANEANFLNDDDLVIGIVKNNETRTVRAYPHIILDWHEIINDAIGSEFVTINYCPLTGTAFGWESATNGLKTTFGVSGLLYNANLILYDRSTESNWSQLKLQCVNGSLIGKKPKLVNIIETNWKTWKTLYPNTEVLSLNTGFSRNYGTYPYGPYKTSQNLFLFQPSFFNNALPNKERVYTIISRNKAKVYQFSNFKNGKVIKNTFSGKDFLIVGNENIISSFELSPNQINLDFEYDFSNSEIFFKDNEGNKWSIFGEAIEGPRAGEKLLEARSVIGYWFAIAVFYPNPEIYTP